MFAPLADKLAFSSFTAPPIVEKRKVESGVRPKINDQMITVNICFLLKRWLAMKYIPENSKALLWNNMASIMMAKKGMGRLCIA